MRLAIVVLGLVLFAGAGGEARAAPWCGSEGNVGGGGGDGGTGTNYVNCVYRTFESCVQMMLPVRGSCIPNPDGSALRSPPMDERPRRSYNRRGQ